MADGGASTFILLITALLVSGSVSAILINQWGDMSSALEENRKGKEADAKTSVSFAGDAMEVGYDDSVNPNVMTFYLQNTGQYVLDESTLVVIVDGISVTSSITTTILPNGADWTDVRLLEVEVSSTSWSYQNDDSVSLSAVVSSEVTSGYRGTSTMNIEVRLNV
jgi:archaellum component FlaG (FlaF/FlaG flagellin family)